MVDDKKNSTMWYLKFMLSAYVLTALLPIGFFEQHISSRRIAQNDT